MLKIDVWREAKNFVETLPIKRQRQLTEKIDALALDSLPPRSKLLMGFAPLRRFRSGDYRIIYFADKNILNIVLIDKRNDDAIYRRLEQMFR